MIVKTKLQSVSADAIRADHARVPIQRPSFLQGQFTIPDGLSAVANPRPP